MANQRLFILGGQSARLLTASLVLLLWGELEWSAQRRGYAADVVSDSRGAASPDADQQRRKAELEEMRLRAEATKVHQLDGAARTALKLAPTPLMRYSDQPTSIVDATLWAYADADGRPVVLQKIESCPRPWATQKWMYALFSLSEGLIEAQWRDGQQWQSTRPGIELRPLPDGPKAADNRAVRLRQMKDISRRFSVVWSHPGMGREELRLLAQPLYRYGHPESGLQDGALIGFAAKGTNPDAVMLVELRGNTPGDSAWRYGFSRMTNAQVEVRLDQKEVWSAPCAPGGSGKHDTWLFFREANQPRTQSPLR